MRANRQQPVESSDGGERVSSWRKERLKLFSGKLAGKNAWGETFSDGYVPLSCEDRDIADVLARFILYFYIERLQQAHPNIARILDHRSRRRENVKHGDGQKRNRFILALFPASLFVCFFFPPCL